MTPTEEAAFLDIVKTLPFGAFRMHGVDAKRRVVRFGIHYVAGSAAMVHASAFPLSLEPLRERAAAVANVPTGILSESLVTEYAPGAGIGWHCDSPPFGIVVGIPSEATAGCAFNVGKDHNARSGPSICPRDPYM